MNPAANDPKLDAAIRMLGEHSTHFDAWALMGPRCARTRAEIMSALMGRRIPQAQSGVTAIIRELWTRANITGDHIAAREKAFEAFAAAVVAQPFGVNS